MSAQEPAFDGAKKPRDGRVSDFDFNLPEDLIAQTPPAVRGSSRMLVLDRTTGAYTDDHFTNLPSYLRPGDLLILNNSRVIPARLYAVRAGPDAQPRQTAPGGRIEVLLTRQLDDDQWTALVRPARKVQVGQILLFASPEDPQPLLRAEVVEAGEFGERTLRFSPTPRFFEVLDRIGHMPLPPYIHRPKDAPDAPEDRNRYQTVYADQPGSAAAPTAGLHFTSGMIDALRTHGVQVETVMLHVGLGTFQPVRVEKLEDVHLHAEHYVMPDATADAIESAYLSGRRIIAVGTTSARTLEAAAAGLSQAAFNGKLPTSARSGNTDIFLSPGHNFRLINGLITNFHLPQSTLLMLVSAFAGREAVLAAYTHAIEQRYRFFSYGDCMLIL